MEHGTLAFQWQCKQCSPSGTPYRFSVLVGTIFENTNDGFRGWFKVIHLMLAAKKGISVLQIQRFMAFGSYKTAWYMCHLVRARLASLWSLAKRGIVGSYHKVSRKYLPLYVAEFQFRYNNRANADIFEEAIRGC